MRNMTFDLNNNKINSLYLKEWTYNIFNSSKSNQNNNKDTSIVIFCTKTSIYKLTIKNKSKESKDKNFFLMPTDYSPKINFILGQNNKIYFCH